jgi:PLP dependent protein
MTDRDQLRREELNSSLSDIRSRIVRARESSGRTDTVDLLVVTKTFPASDVEILADLGVRDVGENRDQEAKAKKLEVHARDLRWHMIGRLQRNKAGSVARWADIVESVDRMALVQPLADAVARAERESPLEVLIQVNLDPPHAQADSGDGAAERGGALVDRVPEIATAIAERDELRLAGVMAVAPHPDSGVDPAEAFTRLAEVSAKLRERWPEATLISAGMSDDLEQAVACGATQVRIGGAILGQRPAVQ